MKKGSLRGRQSSLSLLPQHHLGFKVPLNSRPGWTGPTMGCLVMDSSGLARGTGSKGCRLPRSGQGWGTSLLEGLM